MPKPNYLTTTQAARRCGISAASIRRACAAGTLPAVKLGKTWLIKPDALQKWVDDPVAHKPGVKAKRAFNHLVIYNGDSFGFEFDSIKIVLDDTNTYVYRADADNEPPDSED